MAAVTARTVDTKVGPISVQDSGRGRPLVYLHSAMGEGTGLQLLADLGDHFSVTAPMLSIQWSTVACRPLATIES